MPTSYGHNKSWYYGAPVTSDDIANDFVKNSPMPYYLNEEVIGYLTDEEFEVIGPVPDSPGYYWEVILPSGEQVDVRSEDFVRFFKEPPAMIPVLEEPLPPEPIIEALKEEPPTLENQL